MICGVYMIQCKINKKIYIGAAKIIFERYKIHKKSLNSNTKGCNKYLQEDWNKYGEQNFEFNILEECNKENLLEREMYYTLLYKSNEREFGYNILIGNKGMKHSDESKLKMSNSHKGIKFSEESKLKMSIMRNGINNGFYGKNHSEETKLKISKINKNNKNMLGKKHSEESKLNISNSHKGKKHSEKTKIKMSNFRKRSITIEQSKEIQEKLNKGFKVKDLAIEYNCSHSVIVRIKQKIHWSNRII